MFMKQLSATPADTKYGRVRGRLVEFPNRHLRPVEAYFGLQYASLLKGSLRFMPPTSPTEKWKGVRVALKPRPVCPQMIVEDAELKKKYPQVVAEQLARLTPFVREQTEDCLTLNLYVPTPGRCSHHINHTRPSNSPPQAYYNLYSDSHRFWPHYPCYITPRAIDLQLFRLAFDVKGSPRLALELMERTHICCFQLRGRTSSD